jgi:hypothetical protein
LEAEANSLRATLKALERDLSDECRISSDCAPSISCGEYPLIS